MAKTKNKQCCPTCGQSVNKREIKINTSLVDALIKIEKYTKEKGMRVFTMKDVQHLLNRSQYCNLSIWKLTPLLTKEKNEYFFDWNAVREFLGRKKQVPIIINKDPLTHEIEYVEWGYINDIPRIADLLDDEGDYLVQYRGQANLHAGTLF